MPNVFDEQAPQNVKSIGNVFADFLLNKGLYDEIEITADNYLELADLVGGHVRISVYCPQCKENRVFSSPGITYYRYMSGHGTIKEELESAIRSKRFFNPNGSSFNDFPEEEYRIMKFKFVCAMNPEHHLYYIVMASRDKVVKIGQYPSFADLSFPELKEYRKVITEKDEKELKRAIGLFANGIGIGSYVYLRRIFERIIDIAGKKAIADEKVDELTYNKAHVDEKIKMLAEYLPKALTNNPVSYGIISKGIHELSEEECLDFFPVLQNFILMILRQWDKIRKDEEDEREIQKSLIKIAEKIKNSKSI
jgi:hypothetical protein